MPAYEDKDREGPCWKNKFKTEAETDKKKPDFTGFVNIDGKSNEIALWERTLKNDPKGIYYYAKVTAKERPQPKQPVAAAPAQQEIPF